MKRPDSGCLKTRALPAACVLFLYLTGYCFVAAAAAEVLVAFAGIPLA